MRDTELSIFKGMIYGFFLALIIIAFLSVIILNKEDKVKEEYFIIGEWENISLERDCSSVFYNHPDGCSESYYAFIFDGENIWNLGCNKGVQVLKIGNSYTLISNESNMSCIFQRRFEEITGGEE